MTLVVFIVSLLGAMAIGVPVAFSLMFCGVVLMWYMACSIPRSSLKT